MKRKYFSIVPRKDIDYPFPNIFFYLPAVFIMYAMIPVLLFLDINVNIYQQIYFTAFRIPKISRREYFSLDRWDLSKLNLLQKFNCIYCAYANGLVAWFKDVVNQTEIYSCAIKHKTARKGREHHKDFYDYSDFA